jgi:DNA-binding beta-propeller fold protein YncE
MVFAVVVAIFALSATSAGAAVPSEFGSKGTGPGEFEEPSGIAVAQATGDVYVVDKNNARVDSFGPGGAFRFALGWGVLDGKNEFEVCTTTCRAGLPGGGAGQFGSPNGVAVDKSGNFYVVDAEEHRVQKFDSEGHFLLAFGKGVNHSTSGNVCTAAESANCGAGESGFEPGEFSLLGGGLAVDAAGTVYVGDFGRIEKFTATGEFVGQWTVGEGVGRVLSVAVNKSSEVYVVSPALSGVHRYDAFGGEIGVPFDIEHEPLQVALGPEEEVFVDEHEGEVTGQPNIGEYEPDGTQIKSFDIGTKGGKSLAFGDTIERVYVLNPEVVRLVGVPPAGPLTVPDSEMLIDSKPSHAEVEVQIDAEGSPTTYRFEYGETTGYGSETASAVLSQGSGLFVAVPAMADLTGLKPNTLYHFRTVTEDVHGHETFGPDATLMTSPPVLITGESTTEVTAESVRLNVEINPQGVATSYRYEYGLTSAYGQSVPVPDAEAGEEEVSAAHSIAVEHLAASTAYHYRVVATNVFGTVQGPDRTFTTPAANRGMVLADGRMWEMVSPPQKHGAALEAISEEGGLIQSSENGDALAYFGTGPLGSEAEPEGSQNIVDSQFIARRSAPGVWETKDITTPHDRPAGFHPGRRAEYLFFSNDLSRGFVEPFGETALTPEVTERTPYMRETNGGYVPLVTSQNVPAGTKFGGEETGGGDYVGGAELVGVAEDGSSAAVMSPNALTSDFVTPEEPGRESLYRWNSTTRALQLVSWIPGTAEAPQETPAALEGDLAKLGERSNIVRHAVSRDGNRFVYETENSGNERHLFVRDMSLGKSVQLDLHEDGSSGPGLARFQDANVSDSVIYFADEEPLTASSTAERNTEVSDLYRCEVEEVAGGLKCNLRDITVPVEPHEASDVLGNIVGTDESGDRVYFVANGRLTPDAIHGNCPPLSSVALMPPASTSCNLYVYDATTEETRLVAIISGRDFPDWGGEDKENLMWLTARVSPDGRYLAFMSQRSLTGYDNRDAHSGSPDEEVFEYDFDGPQLTCVSCKQTGVRPDGVFDSGAFPGLLVDRPDIWRGQWLAASVPGWTGVTKTGPPVHAAYQSRYLSNNGRLFFDSVDDLVPGDVNGQFDLYEYEPSATGSCGPEAGCVALMSSGLDGRESAFLDASSEGEDVFFMTAAELSPSDTDALNDVYDARVCVAASDCPGVGGGAPPPCETSDACRAAPLPQPDIFGAPSSSTFSGAGNLVPAGAVAVAKAKPLPRARLLANTLKACRKERAKKRRVSCERRARKRYGPPSRKARKAGHIVTTRKGGK